MDTAGPWSWANTPEEDLCKIRALLGELEMLSWKQILARKHHTIAYRKLSPDAKRRLADISADDLDVLVSLRLTGPKRVFGILAEGGTLDLLWWDPEHSVYPVSKSGT